MVGVDLSSISSQRLEKLKINCQCTSFGTLKFILEQSFLSIYSKSIDGEKKAEGSCFHCHSQFCLGTLVAVLGVSLYGPAAKRDQNVLARWQKLRSWLFYSYKVFSLESRNPYRVLYLCLVKCMIYARIQIKSPPIRCEKWDLEEVHKFHNGQDRELGEQDILFVTEEPRAKNVALARYSQCIERRLVKHCYSAWHFWHQKFNKTIMKYHSLLVVVVWKHVLLYLKIFHNHCVLSFNCDIDIPVICSPWNHEMLDWDSFSQLKK